MLNKVMLMGRLTSDPETRYTPSGVAVTKITLAVQRDYVKQGEERRTDFIFCTAFRSTAEFIGKWFKKGQLAVIAGQLQTKTYEEAEGKKRTATDVIIDEIHFADSKKEKDEESQYLADERAGIKDDYARAGLDETDLPFPL